MRRLIVVAGILSVIVAILAVLVTTETATVEAEGISVNENGELVLPQAGQTFLAFMNGAQENPPVVSDTTGLAVVLVNDDSSQASFALMVNKGQAVTQAHIHCGGVGVNGPVVAFLAGNVPGGHNVNGWWIINAALTDANVDNLAGCGNNLQELATHMKNGNAYVNVHTVANGGGEVRGQLFMLPVEADITSFNNVDLTISKGTTVKWTNQAGLPHTTTSGVPGAPTGEWSSGLLAMGQSFSHTFDKPGEFQYFCSIHPSLMQATVTVTG